MIFQIKIKSGQHNIVADRQRHGRGKKSTNIVNRKTNADYKFWSIDPKNISNLCFLRWRNVYKDSSVLFIDLQLKSKHPKRLITSQLGKKNSLKKTKLINYDKIINWVNYWSLFYIYQMYFR